MARIGAATRRLFRGLQRRWRSSLQLRVVSTTLLVSALAISMLGFFLMQQIASNLLHNAKVQAYTQASNGLAFVMVQPGISAGPGPASESRMNEILGNLQPNEQRLGPEYGVAIAVSRRTSTPATWAAVHNSLSISDLPRIVLPGAIKRTAGPAMYYARMPYPGPGGPPTTGLLYAAPFGSTYDLYYFFPLTQLQNELSWIQRTLVLVGLVRGLPARRYRLAGDPLGGQAGGQGGPGRPAALHRQARPAPRGARR